MSQTPPSHQSGSTEGFLWARRHSSHFLSTDSFDPRDNPMILPGRHCCSPQHRRGGDEGTGHRKRGSPRCCPRPIRGLCRVALRSFLPTSKSVPAPPIWAQSSGLLSPMEGNACVPGRRRPFEKPPLFPLALLCLCRLQENTPRPPAALRDMRETRSRPTA